MKIDEIKRDPLTLEKIIIKLMFTNKNVRNKLLPYIDASFFNATEAVYIVKNYLNFIQEFNKTPSAYDFKLALTKSVHIDYFTSCLNFELEEFNEEFMFLIIEQFIKESLLTNEVAELYSRMEDDNFDINDEADLGSKIEEALSFNFNDTVGFELSNEESADKMYDFLNSEEYTISTGIKALDEIIDRGYHTKALSLFMAASGVGKSAIMCSQAAGNLKENKKVLYISLEMSEFRIGQRIVANLLDTKMDDLKDIPRESFVREYNKHILNNGNLFIKEFPPSTVNANHIKSLLKELKNKKGFEPDIIYIDYLSLLRSTRRVSADNPYREQKVISEEIRAIGVINDIPIVSAVQTNRDGTAKTILSIADIAESFGIVMGADLVVGAISDPELAAQNKMTLIVIKNRYKENNKYLQVGMHYAKMKLIDIGDIAHRVGEVEGEAPNLQTLDEDTSESVSFVKDFVNKDSKEKTKRLTNLDFI